MRDQYDPTVTTGFAGASWIKSASSNAEEHAGCVELAPSDDGNVVGLRDSNHPGAAVLRFNATEIAAFLQGAKDGDFDHLL